MTRLINADKLTALFNSRSTINVVGYGLCKAIIAQIEAQPTVDAVPVVHGRWNRDYLVSTNGGGYPVYRCSICEHTYQDIGYYFNYCPNCGARMDGES